MTGYEQWPAEHLENAIDYTRKLLLLGVELKPEAEKMLYVDLGKMALESFVREQSE
jgi:hypothetical protein